MAQGEKSYKWKVQETFARKTEEVQQEKLEKMESEICNLRRRITNLEEENIQLRDSMKSKDKAICDHVKWRNEQRKELEVMAKELEKYRESYRNCAHPCIHQSCIKARARFLSKNTPRIKQKDEQEIARSEKKLRQKAATREDVEEIMSNHLKWEAQCKELQYINTSQIEEIQLLKSELNAVNKKLEDTITRAKTRIGYLNEELEKYKASTLEPGAAAECRRPECVLMAQNNVSLQNEVVTLRSSKRYHQDVPLREDLGIECEKLLNNYDIVKSIECYFGDNFVAKGFISNVFLDSYNKCKKCLIVEHVCKNIEELFKIQTDDADAKIDPDAMIEDLEGVSNAFGHLLQASGITLRYNALQVIDKVTVQVKENIPNLDWFKKATSGRHEIAHKLPIEDFVKLAWSFVTQAYPVIVLEPQSKNFNGEIHKESFSHWREERNGERELVYAQPVVYRSFHGDVIMKGLVGN